MSTFLTLAFYQLAVALALTAVACVLIPIKTKPRRRLVARYYSMLTVAVWMVSSALILCWVDGLVTHHPATWIFGATAVTITGFSVIVTVLAISEARKAREDNLKEVTVGIADA